MSEEAALLRVLPAASRVQAKVVLVGDHRQLGAVGPGGGYESLVARYGAVVHVLAENVRQRDVADRTALAELRDGDAAKAVAGYPRRGRIAVCEIAARPSTRWRRVGDRRGRAGRRGDRLRHPGHRPPPAGEASSRVARPMRAPCAGAA